ncbi:sensor histidine kinase [Bacillus sp. FJAT-49711]|uniref:sensor histidine kinase n=1 Tax=Bacillus sp. FJAT-49711 TaxID=2833585 RepID=UPI001BCA13F9|nr:sensor histidine kinase [Bacillus sp. FJAT-49711]MBS4216813.1 sensor histidine kinase [Bacillus sp. FJAT-49711]
MKNASKQDLVLKLYENSSEPILFFDGENKLIDMNLAAKDILDPKVQNSLLSGLEGGMCLACRGYMNEHEEMTCQGCYMMNQQKDFSSFQVYLETRDRGVVPYIASFQMIDKESRTHVFMLRDLTKQLEVKDTLYKSNLMKKTINAQEMERKRISRELHDSIAQELISSLVELRVLKYMNISAEVKDKIYQTETSINRLLEEVRNLSVELRPALLDDLGLEAAFRTHFKWLEKNYGLLVHFTAEMGGTRFNNEVETIVYRICQEAVFNALKYAKVDEVTVRLFKTENHLELIVEDDGIGFDPNSYESQGTGIGLYGMRERAELIDAEISINSEVGVGTVVRLKIPLSEL